MFTGPSLVEVLTVPDPEVPAGHVPVRVDGAGICGSELHGVRDPGFRVPPLIMGHELAGTTPDGRRVTVNPLLTCGHCRECDRGAEQLCSDRAIIGIHRPGGFAETVVVPERAVLTLPDEVGTEAATLVEPLANAVHALGIAAPRPGSRIAVIGAGPIGLACLFVARQQTADVTVCDLSPTRLDVARALGAGAVGTTLDGADFDVVVDAVGAPATRADSVRRLRPGGTAVWIGLQSAAVGDVDGQDVVRTEKRVVGSYCYTREDFTAALGLAAAIPTGWVTSVPLEQGGTIFTELMNGRADVVKVVLRPEGTLR